MRCYGPCVDPASANVRRRRSQIGVVERATAPHAPRPQVNVYTISIDAYLPSAPFPVSYDGVATLIDKAVPFDTLLVTMVGFSSILSPTVYWSPQFTR